MRRIGGVMRASDRCVDGAHWRLARMRRYAVLSTRPPVCPSNHSPRIRHGAPTVNAAFLGDASSARIAYLVWEPAPQEILVKRFPTGASELPEIMSIPGIRPPNRLHSIGFLVSNPHLSLAEASCGARSQLRRERIRRAIAGEWRPQREFGEILRLARRASDRRRSIRRAEPTTTAAPQGSPIDAAAARLSCATAPVCPATASPGSRGPRSRQAGRLPH